MSLATAARTSVTHLGPPRGAATLPAAVVEIAATLTAAGLPTEALDSADVVIWTKLALAGPMGPVSALLRRTVRDVAENEHSLALIRALFDEIVDVAHATGVPLDATRSGRTPSGRSTRSALTSRRWPPTCSPTGAPRSTRSAARWRGSAPSRACRRPSTGPSGRRVEGDRGDLRRSAAGRPPRRSLTLRHRPRGVACRRDRRSRVMLLVPHSGR